MEETKESPPPAAPAPAAPSAAAAAAASPEVHPMRSVPEALRTVLHVTVETTILQWGQQEQQQEQEQQQQDPVLSVPLSLALGRRLSKPVIMPEPGYPPYRASIMDGYCIRTCDVFTPAVVLLDGTTTATATKPTHVIVDKVYAGDQDSSNMDNSQKPLSSSTTSTTKQGLPTAIYITTGAKVPDGYDCVVPIEECQVVVNDNNDDERKGQDQKSLAILSSAVIAVNQWIRPAGCDLAPGEIVLPVGHVMDAVSLALARQAAYSAVQVIPEVIVGILSTGNELVVNVEEEGEGADHQWTMEQGRSGIIPDVNRPMLQALVASWGAMPLLSSSIVDLGMYRDDNIPALVQCLKQASETCSIIITTGGISMGETDVLEHVLVHELGGTLHFGRLHMKPGKPTTFVTLPPNNNNNNRCFIFALPGNPVSAYVCASLLVQPCWNLLSALRERLWLQSSSMSQQSSSSSSTSSIITSSMIHEVVEMAVVQPEVQAQLTHDISLDAERPEYHRVTLKKAGDKWLATSTGTQRSSRLASLRNADGLLVLPQATPNQPKALAGQEEYTVLLWNETQPSLFHTPTTVATSRHLNPPSLSQPQSQKPALHVALVELSLSSHAAAASLLARKAQSALTGSKSGSVTMGLVETVAIVSSTTAVDVSTVWERVIQTVLAPNNNSNNNNSATAPLDLLIIVTSIDSDNGSSSGMFPFHAQMANELKQQQHQQGNNTRLNRLAPAMAQQVRAGAASEDPTAALWDVVIGFTNEVNATTREKELTPPCCVVFLSSVGFEAALANVRGLIKHALAMARSSSSSHNDGTGAKHHHLHS